MRAEGNEAQMSDTKRTTKYCSAMEGKLVEYLDGRAKPAERRAVQEHLAGCPACRNRAEEFRALWSTLDDLPAISASPSFDASLRARIAAEPVRHSLWGWLPSPRLAFAVTALVAMSVWMASMPRITINDPAMTGVAGEADFGMIRDLPVLENYEVLSTFDALSELPAPPTAAVPGEVTNESRE
jgi:anti-sigma factor RsiW